MEYKIRQLARRDVITVARMIKKLVEKTGKSKLLGLISSSEKVSKDKKNQETEENNGIWVEIGVEVLTMLLDEMLDDITAWFADLVEMSVEDYNNAGLDIDLQIIEQLKESPSIGDFFTRAFLLYKTINASGIQ